MYNNIGEFEIILCAMLFCCMVGMTFCAIVMGVGVVGDWLGYWDISAAGAER